MSKEDGPMVIEKKIEAIANDISIISKILVLNQIKDMQQRESIPYLSQLGFQPKEIAELINTTANTVRVALSKHRKTQGRKLENGSKESDDD